MPDLMTNADPADLAPAPGKPIHVIELLRNEYYIKLRETMSDEAARDSLATCQHFLQFAADYLNQHRPSTLQHVADNYAITLTNHKQFLISPPHDNPTLPQLMVNAADLQPPPVPAAPDPGSVEARDAIGFG